MVENEGDGWSGDEADALFHDNSIAEGKQVVKGEIEQRMKEGREEGLWERGKDEVME